MMEIKMPNGIIAFDGRVIEFFFSRTSDTKRLHRDLIQKIEIQEPKRRKPGKKATCWLRVNATMMQFDEDYLPQVQALVAKVKGG